MLWNIIYCLLVLLPIGTLILNYINYKFKNRLINVLTILSFTLGLYWFPFGINEFKYLEFLVGECGNDEYILLFFIAFAIMLMIDIFVTNRIYKDNKKLSVITKTLFMLSLIMFTCITIPFYFCEATGILYIPHTIMFYSGQGYVLFLLILFFAKSALTVLLFTFLLYKTIILSIHNIKNRIKQ